MVGSKEQNIKNNNAIIFENLAENKKFFLLKNCHCFVMPSFYESLNIACLEAWLFKKPVLVNGESQVLKNHCIEGQCGLYFTNYDEFAGCLDTILKNQLLANQLGLNGEKYVKANFNWDMTRKKYINFFDNIIEKIKIH